jgi:hypothetical protein
MAILRPSWRISQLDSHSLLLLLDLDFTSSSAVYVYLYIYISHVMCYRMICALRLHC